MQRRLLAEQRVEAERLLIDGAKQLRENGDLLAADERVVFEKNLEKLAALAKTETNHEALKAVITEVDGLARPCVETILDRAIGKAAVGHRMEDF